MRPRVKICGLTRPRDAEVAAEAGALYVGAILVPDSPREVTPERARTFHEASGLPLVVVMADLSAVEVALAAERAGASIIQLHGSEGEADLHALRGLGDWELWKALRVRSGAEVLDEARRWAGVADGLLLDGWHPDQLGGTGRTFPWEEVEAIRPEWPDGLSLIAAGGLTAGNVGEAVQRLRPQTVDVSSGVEHQPGVKSPQKIHEFIAAAQDA